MIIHEPQRVKLEALNFAEYNPRIMPADEMQQLKASLLQHGLVLNLVVQKRGMTLIGGHQRVLALRELCEERGETMPTHVWATVLDVDDAQAKRINVALNKIQGLFDEYKLGLVLQSLPALDVQGELAIGFTHEQIATLIGMVAPPAALDDVPDAREAEIGAALQKHTLSIVFDSKESRDEVRTYLLAAGKQYVTHHSGAVLLSLIRAAPLTQQTPKKKRGAKASASEQ